jgi:hypothetical protein
MYSVGGGGEAGVGEEMEGGDSDGDEPHAPPLAHVGWRQQRQRQASVVRTLSVKR